MDHQDIKTTAALTGTCKAFTPFFQPGLAKIKKKIFPEIVEELTLELLQKLGYLVMIRNDGELKKSLVIISLTDPVLSNVLMKRLLEDRAHVVFANRRMRGTLLELARSTGDITTASMIDDYIKIKRPEVKDDASFDLIAVFY